MRRLFSKCSSSTLNGNKRGGVGAGGASGVALLAGLPCPAPSLSLAYPAALAGLIGLPWMSKISTTSLIGTDDAWVACVACAACAVCGSWADSATGAWASRLRTKKPPMMRAVGFVRALGMHLTLPFF